MPPRPNGSAHHTRYESSQTHGAQTDRRKAKVLSQKNTHRTLSYDGARNPHNVGFAQMNEAARGRFHFRSPPQTKNRNHQRNQRISLPTHRSLHGPKIRPSSISSPKRRFRKQWRSHRNQSLEIKHTEYLRARSGLHHMAFSA